MRCYARFTYRAGSWKTAAPRDRPHRGLAAARSDTGASRRLRQEVDVRYVVTSLEGDAERLYEGVYCQRGQAENLIKLHKTQLASDRTSCHAATANQVRLTLAHRRVLADAQLRAAIPSGHAAGESPVQYTAASPPENRCPRRSSMAAASASNCRRVVRTPSCSAWSCLA